MRKLLLLALTLAVLALAGCGGGSGDGASSPLDDALRYLPADTPFAVAIDTDAGGEQLEAAGDLADRLPIGDELRELLGRRGGTFGKLRAALGNELVVGATDARSFLESRRGEDGAWVGAIRAAEPEALDELVEGDRAEPDGEVGDARLYEDDSGGSFAIDGDVLVVAGSRRELAAALATRADGDGLTEDDFDAATGDLHEDALARVYLDLAQLLRADRDAKDASASKWLAAVRTGGVALTVGPGEILVDVRVETDPDGLDDADLPIAPGAEAPQVLDRGGQVDLALRDPGQLLAFALATAGRVGDDPDAFADGKAELERELGVDIDRDLVAQLDGDLAVSVGPGERFGARVRLGDPAAVRRMLVKLKPALPELARQLAGERVGVARPKAGEDFYAVATAGGEQVVFGVVGDFLVISNSAAIAGTIATEQTEAVPGARGALVLRAGVERIAKAIGRQPAIRDLGLTGRSRARAGARPLDELLGSIEASPDGLSGSFTITTD